MEMTRLSRRLSFSLCIAKRLRMLEVGLADQNVTSSEIHGEQKCPDAIVFTKKSSYQSNSCDHEFISQLSKDLVARDRHNAASIRKRGDSIKNNRGKKECHIEISRTESILRKQEWQREPPLDLNSRNFTAGSSPRFAATKRASEATRPPGAFSMPDSLGYCHGTQASYSWKPTSASLLPFNRERTLPSKWEDAEKWIFSPVYGRNINCPACVPLAPPMQPKSKSGPLGRLGVANYASSAVMQVFDGEKVALGSSPFSTGVLAPDALPGRAIGGSCTVQRENLMARSSSAHGWFDMQKQFSLPKDIKYGSKDASTISFPVNSRRDMATQISPVGSTDSSPNMTPDSTQISALPILKPPSKYPSKLRVKDVQVDDHVTITKCSKKHGERALGKCSTKIEGAKKNTLEAPTSPWLPAGIKSISRFKRDEANIIAWENLQKAKAEAKIRKLEMKIEKMRTSSMDKIMKKLRLAQRKAQELRSSASANRVVKVQMTAEKAASLHKACQVASLKRFFMCQVF